MMKCKKNHFTDFQAGRAGSIPATRSIFKNPGNSAFPGFFCIGARDR
jgi:hypothetical protein